MDEQPGTRWSWCGYSICCLCQVVSLFLQLLHFLRKVAEKPLFMQQILSGRKHCLLMYNPFTDVPVFCSVYFYYCVCGKQCDVSSVSYVVSLIQTTYRRPSVVLISQERTSGFGALTAILRLSMKHRTVNCLLCWIHAIKMLALVAWITRTIENYAHDMV